MNVILHVRNVSGKDRNDQRSPSKQRLELNMRAALQVDFGGLGLGEGTSDLEHSIMLRQRSLSSRTSLDDMAR